MSKPVTVDFDQHSATFAADPWRAGSEMAAKCPVAWSEHHGGFWVVTGLDQVREVSRDSKTFSSRHDLPTGSTIFQGVNTPPVPGRYLPLELDPPEQLEWRRALAGSFTLAMGERLKPWMEWFSDYCLDQVAESGRIDFVMGLSSAVPAMVTLHMLGLPLAHWRRYVEITHKINYVTGPERDAVYAKFDAMSEDVARVAAERRAAPRDDLLTTLGQMEIGGKPLSIEEIASVCGTIIAGGIDTTSAVVAAALKHLGEQEGDRQRLIEDPAQIPKAMEEFLRYVSPVTGLARTCTRDVEVAGQQIKRGERVVVMWHSANQDPKLFPDPGRVDFDRDTSNHVTFGYGAHRCLGSAIARVDIPVMLSKVLTRIPGYRLVPDGAVRYPSIGLSNNYIAVPATFEPIAKVGIPAAVLAQLEGEDAS